LGFALFLLLSWRLREMDPEIERANAQWLEDRIARITKDYYSATLSELTQVRARLLAIRMRPQVAIPDIIERHTARQRQIHLATLLVSGARLPDATREDRKRLAAMGVVTAADVLEKRDDLHHAVRYATVLDLVNWAENRSAEFLLDPGAPMPADPHWASKDMEAVVAELMHRLAEGPDLLRQRRLQVEESLDALYRRARAQLLTREIP
jgi:DNA-binding helix-hairpin-helix protein with protein kinase domain